MKEKIIAAFREKFVMQTYPFLGGQRNYIKVVKEDTDHMKVLNDMEKFLSTALDQYAEEVVGEILSEKDNTCTNMAEIGYCYHCDGKEEYRQEALSNAEKLLNNPKENEKGKR